ncbi:MAG: ABC transporter permease [Treponema sp.]|nr:ABC transporter permease [Treponema sp.]
MKKQSFYKALKIFVILLCAAGVALLAVYPFKNRDLTLRLVDKKGSVLKENFWTAEQIAQGQTNKILLPLDEVGKKLESGEFQALVSAAKVYGMSKTTVAKEFDYNAFNRMIAEVQGASYNWTPSGVEITGRGDCSIFMTEEFTNRMRNVSRSLLQERLMAAGYFACLMVILFIIINVFEEKLSDTVKDNHSFLNELKKFFFQMKRYKNYMVYSAKADLNAEVANSYLNRLWWLLEPMFNMLVYVIIFGRVMGSNIQNYATYVFSALLMWNYFSKTVNYSVKLVRNNRDIVTKVYVPKFVLLLSNMFLNFFKLVFSLSILVFMLIVFKVQIGPCILLVIPAYCLMILLSFGAGMILLHFGVFIDDLAYAVGILLNMLMFLSGIFYNVMTTLPEPLNVLMMTFNPVALFVEVMRSALLSNTIANLPLLGLWTLVSLLLCYIGVHIVYRNENSYVKIV